MNKEQKIIPSKEDLQEWVGAYYKELIRWAMYKTNDYALAEDLVQDTFMAAWKGLENFESKSQPKTWLFQILNHKIIDHYRKKKNGFSRPMDTMEANKMAEEAFNKQGNWEVNGFEPFWKTDHLMDQEDFQQQFKTCLASLPDNWNRILSDKYFFSKKPEIICQENQISTTNYWQVIHRAKILLKKCLEFHFQ